MSRMLVSLILFSAFASSAVAEKLTREECVAYDVSDKMGPVRQQSAIDNWCWAMTAADLMGYYQGITPRNQISTMDVVVSTEAASKFELQDAAAKQGIDDSEIKLLLDMHKTYEDSEHAVSLIETSGFSTNGIIAYQRNGGWCSEKKLPSQGATPDFIETALRNLGDSSKTYDREYGEADRVYLSNYSDCDPKDQLRGIGGVRTAMQLQFALNDLAARKVKENIDQRFCRRRKPLKPMVPYTIYVEEMPDKAKVLALIAGKNKGPIGINFFSGFLKRGRLSPNNSPHTVSVVGMRWTPTGCEFKIRNSLGKSCEPYDSEIAKACDEGNIWLTEADMNRRLVSIFGIN
jgi:hypothetical protein